MNEIRSASYRISAPSTVQYQSIISRRRLVCSTMCDSFLGDAMTASCSDIEIVAKWVHGSARQVKGSGSILAQAQHCATGETPITHYGERLPGLFERKNLRRRGFDQALLVELECVGEARRHLRRPPLAVVADLQPADLNVLEQQVVGLDRWDMPARESDHDQPAAPGQRSQRCLEYVAAERIEDDIDAASLGRRPDLFAQSVAQILARQVDHHVGTECSRRPLGS